MRVLACVGVGVFALFSLGGAASAATPLPASNGIAGCVAGGVVVSTNPCSFGGASAFTVGAPFATAEATVTAPPPFGAGANSAFTYYYTVDGPDDGPIAIGIGANLLTSASPDNTAFAGISTSQGTSGCADTNEGLCSGSQFGGTLVDMDEPGQVYFVHLEAVASVGVFGGSAFASADPYIFVESTDPNADLYTIRLSDGVANGVAPSPGSVPEPSTWAMLLLGFAGIGLAGYRRARESRGS
jgi:PEP-CTERM motif